MKHVGMKKNSPEKKFAEADKYRSFEDPYRLLRKACQLSLSGSVWNGLEQTLKQLS